MHANTAKSEEQLHREAGDLDLTAQAAAADSPDNAALQARTQAEQLAPFTVCDSSLFGEACTD